MGDLDRIRWRCRRGLLELDLVLQEFIDRRYPELDAEGRRLFSELLEQPDNDLLDLALGRREPVARYRTVVALLRGSGAPGNGDGMGTAQAVSTNI